MWYKYGIKNKCKNNNQNKRKEQKYEEAFSDDCLHSFLFIESPSTKWHDRDNSTIGTTTTKTDTCLWKQVWSSNPLCARKLQQFYMADKWGMDR